MLVGLHIFTSETTQLLSIVCVVSFIVLFVLQQNVARFVGLCRLLLPRATGYEARF